VTRRKQTQPAEPDLFSEVELEPPAKPQAKPPAKPKIEPPAVPKAVAKKPARAAQRSAAEAPRMTVFEDLEARVRAHGVRVEERLKLIRLLADAGGADSLQDTIGDLNERMRTLARKVQGELR